MVGRSYPLDPGFGLELVDAFEAPASVLPRVDAIWAAERERRGDRLFNGRVYGLAAYRRDELAIRACEYRFALAARRDPALRVQGLDIRPLAVTGVLTCADGLVLGRRGPNVADDAGVWEPAPAGSLSKPDPLAQLFEELDEELGLSRSRIVSARACGLVEDAASGVTDIVFRLSTAATGQDIRAAHAGRGSDEYDRVAIVSAADAVRETHRRRMSPVLRPMLELASVL